jgi:cell fate (sporulation/competence/biofilm development) regulator YmcA (YheA/YmcA/DUF963 family)
MLRVSDEYELPHNLHVPLSLAKMKILYKKAVFLQKKEKNGENTEGVLPAYQR